MKPRREDWQNRLVEYFAGLYRLPFDERARHCGYMTGDAIFRMTDSDPLEDLRDCENLTQILERLASWGFAGPADYAASLFEEVPPLFAGPGDLVSLPGEGGESMGIVQGDYVYACGTNGLMQVPRSEIRRAFHVPLPGEVVNK